MYSLITSAVTLSPTVRAKYPSSQNSPPHNSTLGNSLRISLALTAFRIPTTFDIEYFGEKLIKMWYLFTAESAELAENQENRSPPGECHPSEP